MSTSNQAKLINREVLLKWYGVTDSYFFTHEDSKIEQLAHRLREIGFNAITERDLVHKPTAQADDRKRIMLRYGRHDSDCSYCNDSAIKPRPDCSCGFTSALDRIGGTP